ncbi:MAG: tripartite tricarboxylate transporter permease [Firmicutes bacterium]|nr:tripartite tricarboxylate transporter permease [Bacillota bacterium]
MGEFFLQALKDCFTLQGIVFIIAGSLAGVILGAIPGLGSSTLLVVLLPIAYKMDPKMCMALFISVVIGGMSGGCIGSILLGIPGTSSSLCTVWDGYEFTKQGDPVRALSAAVTSSFLGTVPSVIVAIFACRVIAMWAVNLGPWEYAALCYCAILMVVGLSKGNLVKGMLGVGLAMFMASIGTDPITARGRFVFGGNFSFLGGLNLISIMLGLFASKIIMLEYAKQEKADQSLNIKVGKYRWPGKDLGHNLLGFIRSWVLGLVIGFLPGLGGPVASIMAYSTENMLAKDKSKWGKGEIMGVISGETAKNSAIGGALIPLIALGIPGDASCVQFISALNTKGITASPMLIRENPGIVYVIFTAALISAIVIGIYETIGMPTFPALLKIPYHYLYSIIIVLALTGAYMSTQSFFGLFVALFSCILGVIMDLLGVSSLPFLMAFILSPQLEMYLRRGFTYSSTGGSEFFTRPISCAFIVIGTAVLIYGIVSPIIKKGKKSKNDQAREQAAELED